mgnify:CR=1 FL=1
MSQHDFVIANQSFPDTRTDLNAAILAVASNSSAATAPATTYANQFWYDTSTNILYIRNEANDGWVSVITLDASMTATASELNQLDAITRGSILYGNASGATARLAKGGAGTVLTSDGTDISWAAASAGASVVFPADWASPTTTFTSSGTYSKGSLADDDFVWVYLVGGGGGGGKDHQSGGMASSGRGGYARLIYISAGVLDGAAYVVAAGAGGSTVGDAAVDGIPSTLTLTAANSGTVYSSDTGADTTAVCVDVRTSVTPDVVDLPNITPHFTMFSASDAGFSFGDAGLPTGVDDRYKQAGKAYNSPVAARVVMFGGGGGGSYNLSSGNRLPGASEFAGDGGAAGNPGVDGSVPGGGGGASTGNVTGGDGGAGNIRIYNV